MATQHISYRDPEPRQVSRVCPRCHGRGWVPHPFLRQLERCPLCQGKRQATDGEIRRHYRARREAREHWDRYTREVA